MTYVVDTVGKITLPTGETCHGIILTGSKAAVQAAARLWSEHVELVEIEQPDPWDEDEEGA